MDIAWYLVLSAFIFCIGVAGVLTRRSPLVILICLELMLNAGNLALVAFSKMTGNGDGQIFALIVMIVAAAEVVVGLGVIVAMFRNRLPMLHRDGWTGPRTNSSMMPLAWFVWDRHHRGPTELRRISWEADCDEAPIPQLGCADPP